MSQPADGPVEVAEVVAQRVLSVAGVSALHAGMFGEVATYLPGRRLVGVRVADDHIDVHVVMQWGRDVREVATAVRTAVAEVAPGTEVSVTVEDVALPEDAGPDESTPHDSGVDEPRTT